MASYRSLATTLPGLAAPAQRRALVSLVSSSASTRCKNFHSSPFRKASSLQLPQAASQAIAELPSGRIIGVGVDILHRPRLTEMWKRRQGGKDDPPDRFVKRILSSEELNDFAHVKPRDQESWLAVRWTAKEAAYKALYPTLRLRWSDLAVSKRNGKKPCLFFSSDGRYSGVDDAVRLHLSNASRYLSSSAPRLADRPQAIKSTTGPNSDQPANPSPPPRAAAASPQPGSESLTGGNPAQTGSERRPAQPPMPPAHSALKIKFVKAVARLMGYNSAKSRAIRVTSDLYDRCAARWELDEQFWQGECHLPPTYQSWFQVTNFHVMLLLLRFRAMDPSNAAAYQQELINHFFIDAETRMRLRFGVQTSRLVKGYMKEMHTQHRGAILAIDEAVAMLGNDGQGDSRLAMALWRNLFGAGWGNVGGVLSKVKGVDASPKGQELKDESAGPNLAPDAGPQPEQIARSSAYATNLARQRMNAIRQGKVTSFDFAPEDPLAVEHPEFAFPIVLTRLTNHFLKELRRLAAISDHEIEYGRVSRHPKTVQHVVPPPHIVAENKASVGAGETIEKTTQRPLGLDVMREEDRKGKTPPTENTQQVEEPGSFGSEEEAEEALSVANFGRP